MKFPITMPVNFLSGAVGHSEHTVSMEMIMWRDKSPLKIDIPVVQILCFNIGCGTHSIILAFSELKLFKISALVAAVNSNPT